MKNGVVIIGGSIAGYHVVKELRKRNYEGKITLIEKQEELPYNLYPLSKEWLRDKDLIEPPFFKERDFYDDNNITLKLGKVVNELNPSKSYVKTDDGETIYYEKLVIAIGSKLRFLDIKGAELNGIFYLRNYHDAKEIKEWSSDINNILLVGAGFIGLELAASLTMLGKKVTVVESSNEPLARILGSDASKYFVDMHEKHGVKFVTGEVVNEFVGDNGKISKVITSSGKEIKTEMVIVGIGVIPNTSIKHNDLDVERGIIVNKYGETSIPNIFAAGDCTVFPYHNKLTHIEHWEHAYNQGINVARNIINPHSEVYDVRPYFWTDQYDQTFEYLGHALTWDRIIKRGDFSTGKFTLAYVDENNMPLAILFANNSEKRKDVQAFMDKNKPIDETKFTDLKNNLIE